MNRHLKETPRKANREVLQLERISKTYLQGSSRLKVLDSASFKVNAGEIVALIGPSGSGKSTLMHIAGLLDKPNSGKVYIEGKDTSNLSDDQRSGLRLKSIGFVYQFHHLLAEFTALENVMLPQLMAGVSKKLASEKAKEYLRKLGLENRFDHNPKILSGGEQQRVAIARSLINDPALLLADEPTGNLDHATAESVFTLMLELVAEHQLAAVIVTHNQELASRMQKSYTISKGAVKLHI